MASPPSLTSLADAAVAAPALSIACRLAEWIGGSRELTTTGVLRPAVAAEACRELGIELPRGGKLRSAKDVTELQQAWEVAVAAGLVLITAKRVSAADDVPALAGAVRAAEAAGESVPTELAERVVAAWLCGAGLPLGIPEDPCTMCLAVLHELSLAGKPAEMSRLADVVLEAMQGPLALDGTGPGDEGNGPCPHCGQDHEAGGVTLDAFARFEADDHVIDATESLVSFGAAVTGPGSGPGGSVTLTSLGQLLAIQVMTALAADPDMSAAEVAEHIAGLPGGVASSAAGPWFESRNPRTAVAELLRAAEAASGEARRCALALAQTQGAAGVAAWREFAGEPGFGAYARQWLLSRGEAVEPDDRDEAWLLVDAVVQATDSAPLPVVAAVFGRALTQMTEAEADDVLAGVRDCGHPSADEVSQALSAQPRGAAAEAAGLLAEMLGGTPPWFAPDGEDEDDDDRYLGYDNDVPEGTLYELKVTLKGVSKPPVWRRLLVPADIMLDDLSAVIQRAMGWHGGHLHSFANGMTEFGPDEADLGSADEADFELADLMQSPGAHLLYTYDFGDDWDHEIKLEKIIEPGTPAASRPVPQCLAGKGECPPEDCGGAYGYAELKAALADPSHEDHDDLLDWLGLDDPSGFDPAGFTPDEANARLRPLQPR